MASRIGRITRATSPCQRNFVATVNNTAEQATIYHEAHKIADSTWLKGTSTFQHNVQELCVDQETDKELKVRTPKTEATSSAGMGSQRFTRYFHFGNHW